MRYTKELTHLTTLRLSPKLREEAERYAEYFGMSFSAFVRESIARNIYVSKDIEREVLQQTSRVSRGYPR
jgi:predicted DNA-binding protein